MRTNQRDDQDGDHQDHDRGLAFDVATLMNRRRALTLLGGAGLVTTLAACGATSGVADTSATSSTTAGAAATTTTTGSTGRTGSTGSTGAAAATATEANTTAKIPEETNGPFPADGTNGKNILDHSGIVRRDIVSSFGSGSGVAGGVALTIKLKVLSVADAGAALAGAAVYVWHCDREGRYSMYSEGVTNENYLRGVQEADADGEVTFTSIFPGAYSGRWPHIHFEVYPSVDQAVAASSKIRTSQVALPEDACDLVYATDGYSQSVKNMEQTPLANDMVFRDGWTLEMGTVTGDVTNGMTVALNVPV